MSESTLYIEQAGFPPFSARGCTQNLAPMAQGQLLRTVDGRLVFTAPQGHAKYESTIHCKDEGSPALNQLWRGSNVTVHCIQRLSQEVHEGQRTVTLSRAAVPNSLSFMDQQGAVQPVLYTLQDTEISLPTGLPHAGTWYLSYRPMLKMVVKDFHLETNEWGLKVGWTLNLQEA